MTLCAGAAFSKVSAFTTTARAQSAMDASTNATNKKWLGNWCLTAKVACDRELLPRIQRKPRFAANESQQQAGPCSKAWSGSRRRASIKLIILSDSRSSRQTNRPSRHNGQSLHADPLSAQEFKRSATCHAAATCTDSRWLS